MGKRSDHRRTFGRKIGFPLAAAALWSGAAGNALADSPNYHAFSLGLTDPAHTGINGDHDSYAALVNAAGQVVGYSSREVSITWNPSFDPFTSWVPDAAWHYDGGVTTRIGLYDGEHTASDGSHFVQVDLFNDQGWAAGRSGRYSGGNSYLGDSAWVYHGGVTKRVGFIDALHTAPDGSRSSFVMGVENGLAVGVSQSYPSDDPSVAGQTAWWQLGVGSSGPVRIGFYDAAHTDPISQLQFSSVTAMNHSGDVIGSSQRFVSDGVSGSTPWIWSSGGGSSVTPLGFTDAEHTSTSGVQDSNAVLLNDAGHVAGTSRRYIGEDDGGQSAWYYDGATTVRLGLTEADHTAPNGSRQSQPMVMNQASQVAGFSTQYIGNEPRGTTAWLYTPGTATTQIMGFYDAEHISAFGDHSSGVNFLTDGGIAAGSSVRYNGQSEPTGYTPWVFEGGVTHLTGLYDTLHDNFGWTDNYIIAINHSGQAIGSAAQIAPESFYEGHSTWFYANGVTTRIGLTTGLHVRSDGLSRSGVVALNEAGQAIGTSYRFDATDGNLGHSGWFYDHATGITTPLVFSMQDNGEAETDPSYLGENGVVLGTYRKYVVVDPTSTYSSIEPFYWSMSDGFHDLNEAVGDGGINAAGWSILLPLTRVGGSVGRFIIGQGVRTDGSYMGYLLSLPGGGGWNNPGGGNWHDGGNWNLGAPPTAGDDAIFNVGSQYSVVLNNDAAAHDLNVNVASLTIEVNGHHLTVAGTTHVANFITLHIRDGVLRTGNLVLGIGSQLDLGSGMIIDYSPAGASPVQTTRQLLHDGQIIHDNITPGTTRLGYVDNANLHQDSFAGQPVDDSSILMKLTYAGDADLDGDADGVDIGTWAVNFTGELGGTGSMTWDQGDWDYDGDVDGVDAGLWAQAFTGELGGGGLGSIIVDAPMSAAAGQILRGMGITVVPEPMSVALAGLASGCVLRGSRSTRRRR
ncbi:MAG TPA: hypothetical protein VH518_23470 [Tepidisphaeraceae bacterium]|jgi:hypothetical protein